MQNYTIISLDINDINVIKILNLLKDNYVEDSNNNYQYMYTEDFIKWYLNEKSINIGLLFENELIGFIAGKINKMKIIEKFIDIAEINFLCIHKAHRNNKLCSLLIKEIKEKFNRIGIDEAIFTSQKNIYNILTNVNYFIRFINIKKLKEINYIKTDLNINELEKIFSLPKLKMGLKELILLKEEHIDICYLKYIQYYNKFDIYEYLTKDEFKLRLLNKHINTYILIENNIILDFISYFTLNINVSKYNRITTDAYIYMYTNTTNHLNKMINALIYELIGTHVDTLMLLNIMDSNEDEISNLGFQKNIDNFYYNLFNNKISINPNKLAKILF